MKLQEQAKFKPIIESRITELRNLLDDKNTTADPIKPDSSIGRLSRVDAMQMQQMSMEIRRGREAELSRLERALGLIGDGEFGTCPRCEEDIAGKRLDTVPDAIFCFNCASSLED